MKKTLLTLILLVGVVFGLFAQKLTYQAVVRDNNQQLVVNTDVKATVTITFSTGNPYTTEVNGSTNIHGLLSIEFGDATLNGRDWTNATIAVKVVNAATPSTVYVNGDARPVSAVPYALSVNGQSIQNYLTEHHYVNLDKLEDTLKAYSTTAAMDARHYLTSDSAVIKTMQGNITTNANSIANLTLHTTQRAIRDSVAGQIHDSIAANAHTHENKELLDTYTQTEADLADAVAKKHEHANAAVLDATQAPYTDADSIKLKGIADSAEVNVQSDWKQTDATKDDYIKNKPSIRDTVNTILDTKGYLTSDSAVITALQSGLSAAMDKEKEDSTTLAGRITALESAAMDCNKVKDCIKDTLNKYTPTTDLCKVINTCDLSGNIYIQELLLNLSNRIDEQNDVIDKLNRALDSVSQLIPFVCGESSVVDHEGNKYKTVEITTTSGVKYCWMAENMRCTTAPSESGVTLEAGGYNLTDYSTPRYFPAGNVQSADMDSATYVNRYGILYNFPAAMAINTQQTSFDENHRGICPKGWHMPTLEEFNTLIGTAGWDAPTAFSPLRAGYFNKFNDNIADIGVGYYFWSATPSYSTDARALFPGEQGPKVDAFFRSTAFSVRCLRDK